MKRLIINADDLGISPEVNDAIFQGVQHGSITAASLMVNMPFAQRAAETIREKHPELSLGLHFTFTSGASISPHREIPLLVDGEGNFRNGFPGLWKLLCSEKTRLEVLKQIRGECSAQFRVMREYAERFSLRFDHVDSHQHVHVLPGLFEILDGFSREHGLHLRIPREPFGGFPRIMRRFASWIPGGILKRTLLNMHLKNRCEKPETSDRIGYFGILETGKIGPSALCCIANSLAKGGPPDSGFSEVYEINIHPSSGFRFSEKLRMSSGDLAFHQSPWRIRELTAIESDSFRETLMESGIRLCGFPSLSRLGEFCPKNSAAPGPQELRNGSDE